MSAFHPPPAVVLAARAAGGLEVDLLPRVLPDVTDEEIACEAVEAEAPRIAQAVRPDLGPGAGHPKEGVGGGNPVGCRPVDVDAENLAKEAPQILGVVVDIARAAAVADANVQVTVGAKGELAAIVIRSGLGNGQQDGAGELSTVGIARRRVPSDDHIPCRVRVVHIEEPVGRVARMKGEPNQPSLTTAGHERGNIEEWSG
jgi:hypothetical protein